MANSIKITKRFVDQATPPTDKDQILFWDSTTPGFGLRVTKAGAKSYVFRYRDHAGHEKRGTIGKHGGFTPDQAREEARDLYAKVRRGENPFADRKALKAAPDVNKLCDDYIERHAKPNKRPRSLEGDESLIRRIIKPQLGKKKIQDVTFRDIERVAALMSSTPTTANRLVALLSKMFNLGKRWGWCAQNPTEGWKKHHEERRERPLTQKELNRLYVLMEGHPNQKACDIVRFLLLTGARCGEVFNMRWTHVNLDTGNWVKPSHNTKQKRTERLPLSKPAIELLKQRHKLRAEEDTHVFPGKEPGKPLTTLKTFWGRIRREAGIPEVRLHDLRHTTATLMASSGASLPMIGRQLGHTQHQTTLRYAHLYDDDVRESANKLSEVLSAATRGNNEN
ncbi:site-specific integrase [Labrenzia sp. R5_0]|uniref:tyrosine-type recombinase/integrase n=1 Tax=Labrenzia sp. R5_0 TaxID=2821108 RepID=UPI001ADA5914|nr:site-specific integrase [Labrenzia sp. R5_0]MBO9461693.1 tyrosine-type recombinase/integrase [Labrenzia sp. R5_0]